MISFLSYSKKKNEQNAFNVKTKDVCCRITDEDMAFDMVYCYDELLKKLDCLSSYNISIVDLLNENGIVAAENVRKKNRNIYMVLIADSSISPTEYIKPTIMASFLLLRPITKEMFETTVENALREYLKNLLNSDSTKKLIVENKGERNVIPYSDITYLESRDKKIFVVAGKREYSFYDTLDKMEQQLGDDFIRCHRSFIVSRLSIKTILFSKNYILLDDESQIPISRTYKSRLKELK